jgi:hypothetical protein
VKSAPLPSRARFSSRQILCKLENVTQSLIQGGGETFHAVQRRIAATAFDVYQRGDAELRPRCQFSPRQVSPLTKLADHYAEVLLKPGELPLESSFSWHSFNS